MPTSGNYETKLITDLIVALLGSGNHVTGDVTTELDRQLLAGCVSYKLTRRLLQVPAFANIIQTFLKLFK